jgi:hypothetical protein
MAQQQQQQHQPWAAQQQQPLGGFGGYQVNPFFGPGQFPSPYGNNPWQQAGDGSRQPIKFAALPIPVQPYEVQAACSWATNCWPELPADRLQGVFSISQTGEILTVRAPREGEEWMRANAREDEQRWAVLNSAMAVLSSSKTTPDRMMLDQYEALVQPTQFLEHLRKTMSMSEAQLDMVSSMHECMFRRLNALEMLHKGGAARRGRINVVRSSWSGEEEGECLTEGQEGRAAERWRGRWRRQRGQATSQEIREWTGFREPGAVSHSDVGSGLQSAQAAAAATGLEMREM